MSSSRSTHRGPVRQVRSLTVQQFLDLGQSSLQLVLEAGGAGLARPIGDKSLNRPALALTGYFRVFGAKRVQLFGTGEMAYLRSLPEADQARVLGQMADRDIPCLLISRGRGPTRSMVRVAEERGIPLLRSSLSSRDLSAAATILLDDYFAPKLTEHGTLMDIKGIGTFIRGESGSGKSECALALIERGHSLVADDAVHFKLVSERDLVGASPELNRGYMECRGLGIINIAELFGIRSVRLEKKVDLVITLILWEQGMDEERTGLEREYFTILGVRLPHIQIPVRPGRDMARLVEVAAMVEALKQIGHDSAVEYNDRLIRLMTRTHSPEASPKY